MHLETVAHYLCLESTYGNNICPKLLIFHKLGNIEADEIAQELGCGKQLYQNQNGMTDFLRISD